MNPGIFYLYEYENNTRRRNVGFIKVSRRYQTCILQIHVRGISVGNGTPLELYAFYRDSDAMTGTQIATLTCFAKSVSARLPISERSFPEGRPLSEMDGFLIKLPGDRTPVFWMASSFFFPVDINLLRFPSVSEEEPAGTPAPFPEEPESSEPAPQPELPEEPESEFDRVNPQQPDTIPETAPGNKTPAAPENQVPATPENQIPATPENQVPATPETVPENGFPGQPETAPENEAPAMPEPSPENEFSAQPEVAPERDIPTRPEWAPETDIPPQPEWAPKSDMPARPEWAPETDIPPQPERAPEADIPESEAFPEPESTVDNRAESTPGLTETDVSPMPAPVFEKEEKKARKIQRSDISILPRRFWFLANNSFLLHGYHNYNHLLLAEEEGRLWLGVPGIYDPREARAADLFGFPQFTKQYADVLELEPEERSDSGSFGYWCRCVGAGKLR